LREIFFQTFFLHGEKENFEEYSLNLASAELSFPTLINYSASRCRTYPQTTVLSLFYLVWFTLNRYSYTIWDNCV
jgi:hypothetical protein